MHRQPMLQLPGHGPMLVLLASQSSRAIRHLDEELVSQADTIDIRSDVAWVEVGDCQEFLRSLCEFENTHELKVAWCELDSSPQDMVKQAINAPTVKQVAEAIETEDLASSELRYEVYYQPVVRLSNRSIVGFEALMSAYNYEGELSQNDLEQRATRGGWLKDLDEKSRQLGLRGVGPWLGAGLLFLKMMAPDGNFDLAAARRTIRHGEDVGLEPDQMVFEASEQNQYTDIGLAAAQLNKLRDTGVRVAIDQVGDGYSDLAAATHFKPDILKLSSDLIADLPSTESVAIIQAVAEIGHATGAWVVADGVETEAQAAKLVTLKVDWGQGTLFGAPSTKPLD